jgi:integrase
MARIMAWCTDDGRLALRCQPYDRALIERIRSIAGRQWDPEGKHWIIPGGGGALERIVAMFGEALVQRVSEASDVEPPAGIGAPFTETEVPPAREVCNVRSPAAADGALERLAQELRLRNYSRRTQRAYVGHAGRFLREVGKQAAELVPGDARAYLVSLLDRGVSRAYQDQAVSAIRFLIREVLKRPELDADVPRPRRERKLPSVLNQAETRNFLAAIQNPKHRALLMLIYSAGLRVGEVVRLRADDLDLERHLVHVRGGKGHKDRYTLLSDIAVRAIAEYRALYPTAIFLFPGARPDRPIATRVYRKW